MEINYKVLNSKVSFPNNWYLIKPQKYEDLNLKSIDQMEIIDAYAIKKGNKFSNIVSFYECEDFDYEKITFDIQMQKINDAFKKTYGDIKIVELYDYDFNGKKGQVAFLEQVGNDEIFLMQVYFEHNKKMFCYNCYVEKVPTELKQLEKNDIFEDIKGMINEI